jgi:hypothetical protein
MQIAIITFNHLMDEDYVHAGYIDDLDECICPDKSRDVQI